LFDSNSVLSLTEKQFAQQIAPLTAAQQKAKTDEMMARLNLLRQLAAAVAQAGRWCRGKWWQIACEPMFQRFETVWHGFGQHGLFANHSTYRQSVQENV